MLPGVLTDNGRKLLAKDKLKITFKEEGTYSIEREYVDKNFFSIES